MNVTEIFYIAIKCLQVLQNISFNRCF